jgi:hypothetical protein
MFFRRTVYARESIARPLTSSIGRWAVAVLFAFFIARPVAADVRVEEKQNPRSIKIHIFGKFIAKDFHQLDAMLEEIEKDRAPVGITVTLDSPGGAHFEGLKAGSSLAEERHWYANPAWSDVLQRMRINFLWRLQSENWPTKPCRSRRLPFRRSSSFAFDTRH